MKVDDRIRVFISSRCGKEQEKLRIIRQCLKLVLEETGLFKIFLYENGYPSIEDNEEYYLSELKKSDLCLFVIDEQKHDAKTGVFKEYLYAKQHNIKALYIFVTGNEENPNKSVFNIGPKYGEKSYEDIVCEGYNAVITSIVSQYKKTKISTEDRIEDPRENGKTQGTSKVQKKTPTNAATFAFIPQKTILKSLNETNQVIYGAFQGSRNIPSQKNESIDFYTSIFLDKILNPAINGDYKINEITDYIVSLHPKNEKTIITKRFQAIEEIYENGDYYKGKKILEQLYEEINDDANIPQWLIYDILIDLRNLDILSGNSVYTHEWQDIINNLSQPVHYPVIDRSGWNFYEQIEKEAFAESLKGYSEMRFSSWENVYGKNLAEYAVMALYNGSYGHIEQIKVHLFSLSWKTFQDSPEAINYLLQSLKYCILSDSSERFQKIMKKYSFSLSNVSSADINSLFSYGDCIRNANISKKWFFLLLKHIGIFTEEEIFQILLNRLLKDEYPSLNVGDRKEVSNFLECLTENSTRISSAYMVTIMSELLPQINSWDLIKESFSFICKYNFENLLLEDLQKISSIVYDKINLIKDQSSFVNPINILIKIFNDKRSDKKLFREKLEIIDSMTREYLQWEIKLKTAKGIPMFIKWAIDEEKRRNDEYGKNNSWPGYTYFPLVTIESLITKNKKIPIELIKDISDIIQLILENPNQPYIEKTGALDLLYWLIGEYHKQMDHFIISKSMLSSAKSYRLMDTEAQVIEYEIKLWLLHSYISKNINHIENYLAENILSSGYAKEALARAFILLVNSISAKNIPSNIYSIMINFFSISINGTTPDFPVLATIFCLKCIPHATPESIVLKLVLQLCKNGDWRVRYRILKSLKYIKKIDEHLADAILIISKTDQHYAVKKLVKNILSC